MTIGSWSAARHGQLSISGLLAIGALGYSWQLAESFNKRERKRLEALKAEVERGIQEQLRRVSENAQYDCSSVFELAEERDQIQRSLSRRTGFSGTLIEFFQTILTFALPLLILSLFEVGAAETAVARWLSAQPDLVHICVGFVTPLVIGWAYVSFLRWLRALFMGLLGYLSGLLRFAVRRHSGPYSAS